MEDREVRRGIGRRRGEGRPTRRVILDSNRLACKQWLVHLSCHHLDTKGELVVSTPTARYTPSSVTFAPMRTPDRREALHSGSIFSPTGYISSPSTHVQR